MIEAMVASVILALAYIAMRGPLDAIAQRIASTTEASKALPYARGLVAYYENWGLSVLCNGANCAGPPVQVRGPSCWISNAAANMQLTSTPDLRTYSTYLHFQCTGEPTIDMDVFYPIWQPGIRPLTELAASGRAMDTRE